MTGSAKVQYVWGQYIDELIQLKALAGHRPAAARGAATYYLLSDLLYRSAALTNASAGIVEAYDTDAYGNTLLFSAAGTGGAWFTDADVQAAYSACRYVFTGREYDAESQSYSSRARHYQPHLGRFTARDVLTYRDSKNVYEYVGSQVTRRLDPTGTMECDCTVLSVEPNMDCVGPMVWPVFEGGICMTPGCELGSCNAVTWWICKQHDGMFGPTWDWFVWKRFIFNRCRKRSLPVACATSESRTA